MRAPETLTRWPSNSCAIDPTTVAEVQDRLEQVGDDANGGLGGVFKGANTHNSEREFIDAVAALGNSPEAELFRSSLTQSLVDEAKSSQGERADRRGRARRARPVGRRVGGADPAR